MAPALPFLQQYPDITIELISEYESVDIAARGYDAGVRFGADLAQDMISVRISPDVKNTVVGSADYFKNTLPLIARRSLYSIRGSVYALPLMVGCTTGSLSITGVNLTPGSTGLSFVITSMTFSRPLRMGLVLLTSHRKWCNPFLIQASLFQCFRTGAPPGRVYTSIILTGDSIPEP